ncbi:DUF389 domain-containing protein [Desertifilum sp. FACHB-1129]|uniref:TIGR00341 family protein n=1 Tax=Desertifilum tharense IPPAS B-1220 TaxID=1781255 RepID=A0A1E5QPT5_9CYAN|nr:DUF389 domain-containing protein [Desertifilum tharense]MBD2310614.1 DUF389 domain-containing protein [Desertifilum sp. FACHB-1129]MBD2320650.1 DUF389 domain-containing protein [Desertifilum sp. FACHB-866]MBD2330778.1 DUF389 domain-containing protein [Desertifilum sp. FACHB-868]MDA0209896.1 DUF389 domain-containing protein [Cyanobacteria bacterium FC1]OEJ76670.1 hypothetical protein BH720_03710 [Desertifilum tharense IPPAS B-1220]
MLYSTHHFLYFFWDRENENWPWLKDKPLPLSALNRQLWKSSVPSLNYYLLLALSAIISTLGLLADSAATIIGAMIIAPLIGPIMAIAYAMVLNNRRLLKRASVTLITGVMMTVIVAMAIASLIGLKAIRPEILSRANPSLIDLGVAMAAGAAGAYAKSRWSIADALPGVAIAVALVPPLSTIGIGLSLQNPSIAIGASLLFMTNLTGIIFSGGIVLLCQRYGNLNRAKGGLLLAITVLSILGIPLALSLNNLLVQENVNRELERAIASEDFTFPDAEIRVMSVRPRRRAISVELDIVTPELASINQEQLAEFQAFLEAELDQPIDLRVQLIPVRVFTLPASP